MTITVAPEQLQSLSGNVSGGAADIQGTLAALGRQIMPLVTGDWGGPAAGQFQCMWREWQVAATRLNESLSGISRLLANAGSSYDQAESAIARTFRHD